MLQAFSIIPITLAVFASSVCILVGLLHLSDINEALSVRQDESVSTGERIRRCMVSFCGVIMIFYGTSMYFACYQSLTDIIRSKLDGGLVKKLRYLRTEANIGMALWSIFTVAEAGLIWFELVDYYENDGRTRLLLCSVNWGLKSVESILWELFKSDLKEALKRRWQPKPNPIPQPAEIGKTEEPQEIWYDVSDK